MLLLATVVVRISEYGLVRSVSINMTLFKNSHHLYLLVVQSHVQEVPVLLVSYTPLLLVRMPWKVPDHYLSGCSPAVSCITLNWLFSDPWKVNVPVGRRTVRIIQVYLNRSPVCPALSRPCLSTSSH